MQRVLGFQLISMLRSSWSMRAVSWISCLCGPFALADRFFLSPHPAWLQHPFYRSSGCIHGTTIPSLLPSCVDLGIWFLWDYLGARSLFWLFVFIVPMSMSVGLCVSLSCHISSGIYFQCKCIFKDFFYAFSNANINIISIMIE